MPLSACHYAIINFFLFFTAAKITSIILDNIEM